jgi:hypothetical protein
MRVTLLIALIVQGTATITHLAWHGAKIGRNLGYGARVEPDVDG